ncbi:MAG: DUF805 domain-containing protein [Actinobacteria bacterium]|nr:MAG: DUF805 domain-containing protein [Actinomycetota bacterium]
MPIIDTWKLVVLERYAKFDGRAGRPEYWWFALANFLAWMVLSILAVAAMAFADVLGILMFLVLGAYWVGLIVPTIAVAIRRLHDSNKSGWLLLIALIPFGSIVVLVFMLLASDTGANQFGEAAEPLA